MCFAKMVGDALIPPFFLLWVSLARLLGAAFFPKKQKPNNTPWTLFLAFCFLKC